MEAPACLDRFAVGSGEDVAWKHPTAVNHVLACRYNEMHLPDQGKTASKHRRHLCRADASHRSKLTRLDALRFESRDSARGAEHCCCPAHVLQSKHCRDCVHCLCDRAADEFGGVRPRYALRPGPDDGPASSPRCGS